MSEFEKLYYEDSSFWENEMLQDENNRRRFSTTAGLIPQGTETLLDAGCGNGVFVNYLLTHRPEIRLHAMDRSRAALQHVRTDKSEGDIIAMPFADNSFDCVTCLEVLEHLPLEAFQKALSELVRVSKKYIVVSVPYNEELESSYTKCPSCRSVFNYELHLQSFSEDKFSKMFSAFRIKPVAIKKEGPSSHYVGHDAYRKLFYKEQFRQWKSPICPICGYREEGKSPVADNVATVNGNPVSLKQKVLSAFTYLPKRIWPKEIRYYWIIGLFEKV